MALVVARVGTATEQTAIDDRTVANCTEIAMFGKGMSDYLHELHRALDESVKLQSHYAGLLNQYDGGQRLQFADADEWIKRLAELDKG